MSLIKRGDYWHYDFTYKGERYRGTTECKNKWEAQAFENEQRRLVRERNASGFSLADALRLWLTERDRTTNEKQAIKRLLKSYPSRPICQVSSDIREAIPGAAATKNRTISIINAALGLARKRGINCPPNIQKYKEDKTRLRFLTHEEWTRLEAELTGHVLHICQFAVYTGLRSANVLGLKWTEVNLEQRLAWVDAGDAKGRKAISVPLSEKAFRLLVSMEPEKTSDYVFTYKGKPVKSIKTAFNKALDRAGLEDVTFHTLRHTWASWKAQAGCPLIVLKELGGWADISMVQRYSHLSPEHLRQWVD